MKETMSSGYGGILKNDHLIKGTNPKEKIDK